MIHFLASIFRRPAPPERSPIVANLRELMDRKRQLQIEHAILTEELARAKARHDKRSHIQARLTAVTTELLSIG